MFCLKDNNIFKNSDDDDEVDGSGCFGKLPKHRVERQQDRKRAKFGFRAGFLSNITLLNISGSLSRVPLKN